MSQTKTQLVEGLDLASAPADSLVIDTNGKIGVGTTDPGPANIAVVQARDASNYARFSIGQNRDGQGSTGGNHLGLWYGLSNSDRADIFTSAGNMNFWVDGAADGTGQFTFGRTFNTEWMRIDDSGRLLVNQTGVLSNVTTQLIEATGDIVINSATTGSGQTASLNLYHLVSDSSATRPGGRILSVAEDTYTAGSAATSDSALTFSTTRNANLTEKVRIDSDGRLLVGTGAAPAAGNPALAKLVVHGNTNGNQGGYVTLQRGVEATAANQGLGLISFAGDGSTEYAQIVARSEAASTGTSTPARLEFHTTESGSTTPTEWMRITSAGDVGIGVTPTRGPLHIHKDGTTNTYLKLTNGFTGSASGDGSEIIVTTAGHLVFNNRENTPITFQIFGSEMARIDTSGRLLVGTSSNQTGDLIQVKNTDGSGIGLYRANNTNGVANGQVRFEGANGSTGTIMCRNDGAGSSGNTPGRLEFYTTPSGSTTPTERMRIANDGIFNHFTDDHFSIRTVRTGAGPGILSMRNGATGISDGTQVFVVRADGDCENTNGTYTSISDLKFKENVVDAGSQWQDLKAVRIRNFNFKEETNWSTHTQLGVVAQELEVVCPNLVKEVDNLDQEGTYKTVKTSVLYMKAVKALQEAMERIETLEAEVAALKGA